MLYQCFLLLLRHGNIVTTMQRYTQFGNMQTKNEKKHTIREGLLDKCVVLDRIKLVYKLKRNAELARLMNVAPNTITNWYSRGTFDIDKIYTNCVGVNFHWLLTGEGEMLNSDNDERHIESEVIYKCDPKDAEIIASYKDTIETQKDLIASLKQRIKDLECGRSRTKSSVFHSAQSADSDYPHQSGGEPK